MEERAGIGLQSDSDLKNEIGSVLILPLLERTIAGNKREFVLVDPIEYTALTKGLREIFSPLTNERQRVFTAVVFAKGYCPIDLDPVWNPIYNHQNREVTVEFLPKLDDKDYQAMLRIVEKELAGPSLKLGTIILTRDIWPFSTCLKNGEILTRSSIHTPTRGLEDLEISYWDGVGEGNTIKVEISQAGRDLVNLDTAALCGGGS